MPVNIKKMTSVVLLVLFTAAISCFVTAYKMESHAVKENVNGMLYDLKTELNLIEYWNKNLKNDKYLEKEIKFLILSKIFILSSIKPSPEGLGVGQLETFSRAITYNNDYGLSYGEHDDVFRDGLLYLKSIESPVKELIKKRRKMLEEIHKKHRTPKEEVTK